MQMDSLGLFIYRPLKKKKKEEKGGADVLVFSRQNKDKMVLERNWKKPFFLCLLVAPRSQRDLMRVFHGLTVDINIQHTGLCGTNETSLGVRERKPIRKPWLY